MHTKRALKAIKEQLDRADGKEWLVIEKPGEFLPLPIGLARRATVALEKIAFLLEYRLRFDLSSADVADEFDRLLQEVGRPPLQNAQRDGGDAS